MALNFGSFASGIAQAGSEDLKSRRDHALQLKLQSHLIELQLSKEQQMYDYQKASVPATGKFNKLFGIGYEPGARAALPELGLFGALGKAQMASDARKGSGGRDAISGKDANRFLKAKVFKDDEAVTRLRYQAAKGRIDKETPNAALNQAYTEMQSAVAGIDELIKLRKEADASGFTGPAGGRAGSVVGTLTGGRYAGKNMDLSARLELLAPSVAKGAGHVGNLNVQEVKAALQGMGDQNLVGKVAVPRLESVKAMIVRKRDQTAKDFSALLRRGSMTESGADFDPFEDEDPDDKLLNDLGL